MIQQFDEDFKRDNPTYLGLTVNCQCYVRALFEFLMEDGSQKKNLPPPESLASLLTRGELEEKRPAG